ncbi:MAG: type 4a pilus biogenesis protein PilO [Thermoguttaceae bacterium]
MRNSFRQSSWAVTVPLVAIAVAYVSFIWLPGRRAIRQLQQEVETKQAFVSDSIGLPATLARRQQDLDRANAIVTRWEQAAPRKRTIPALYGKIDSLAKDAGLTIAKFDPQPFFVHETVDEIPITVTGSGSFAQIFTFLQGIERLSVTVWVDSLRLERTEKDAKDVRCELGLVVFSDNSRKRDYINFAGKSDTERSRTEARDCARFRAKIVNMEKFAKRLRREFAANPKKAAVLVLVTLVALYFWAPLVAGWLGKREKPASAAALPTANLAATARPTTTAGATDSGRLPAWEQVSTWMHDDPRTTAAALPNARDPFDRPKPSVAKNSVVAKPETRPLTVSPTAAGLVLTGTVIGPQRRLAQIGGRTYAVGQTIQVAKEKDSVAAAFKLTDVQARRAILRSGDQDFELTIPEPGRSGKIELLVPER